ncbi:MAG: dethiobiotin synthase [Verrucomicrobiales bacterium]|nr:dethiobiotin synthase [Verrucomicrobiales bacterium]
MSSSKLRNRRGSTTVPAALVLVTGTGTGVGKTVVTWSLARRAKERGVAVTALKPLCSGGRGDARILHQAGPAELGIDDVNPWHFRAALAPLLAARREGRTVTLSKVLAYLNAARGRGGWVLVEGAGGLRSPLGEDFDALNLVERLKAVPVVVGVNRLGVLNDLVLSVEALPGPLRKRAVIVVSGGKGHQSLVARTNLEWLRQRFGPDRVIAIPWIPDWPRAVERPLSRRVATAADAVWSALGLSGTRRGARN